MTMTTDDDHRPHGEAQLVPAPTLEASREEDDDRPAVGSWWWVRPSATDVVEDTDGDDEATPGDQRYDRPGRQWLGCVVEVGSNYAKLTGVRFSARVALDDFHALCVPEPAARAFAERKIDRHREAVRGLMGQIREVCHRLGVPLRQAIAAAEAEDGARALALVHGVTDAAAYRDALVRAKGEDLPALFQAVKREHEQMALWMKAELIPAKAELDAAEEVTSAIEGKIHLVEIYAGLTEELVCVREGAPAGVDEKVHLLQRRHYMDEECLVNYEAGGMSFGDIGEFDRWIARDANFARIFPRPRSIVAFRVRRNDRRDYPGGPLAAFIQMWNEREKNRRTYLYVRNGDQLHRMETSVEFGEELFPRREDETLLGDDDLWIVPNEHDLRRGGELSIVTGRQLAGMEDYHREKRNFLARQLWQWHRAGKPSGSWEYVAQAGDDTFYSESAPGQRRVQHGRPWNHWGSMGERPRQKYQRLTPENIYYDDVMRRVRQVTLEHNRIAVIVQGLLDRSTCLHPHPPWRLWTPDGFASAIELVYDVSRALTPGEAPDFEVYRRQLNRSLRAGCHAIGQYDAWVDEMQEKYGDKWRSATHFRDDGPELVHPVARALPGDRYEFRWQRERARAIWVPVPGRPGYRQRSYPKIEVRWSCTAEHLTCVDAYTPGDFHLFYDDPRTRADYLRWAPVLLACEDWHHQRALESAGAPTTKKRKRGRGDG